jgi:prephenate dehydrogenase
VRISIVGLGLIGGSAGMAWRAAGHHVVGYARRAVSGQRARELGAIDEIAPTLGAAADVEVAVLAPPVLAIRPLMEQLAPYLRPGAIVTDVASTKRAVERWAAHVLPAHVQFVGGHPMAGKETAGIEHADGALFRHRTWCIVPPPNAEEDAVRRVTALADDTGARTLLLDSVAHDRAVAAVSHLPFMAAIAMAQCVIERDDFASLGAVAGTGLRDMTRLASGDALMHRDICATNRDYLVGELERYAEQVAALANLLRQLPGPNEPMADGPALAELAERFARLKAARDGWLARSE